MNKEEQLYKLLITESECDLIRNAIENRMFSISNIIAREISDTAYEELKNDLSVFIDFMSQLN